MPQKPSAQLPKPIKTASHSSIPKAELRRLKKLNMHESAARSEGFSLIAGVDEAGRGPLAGPVVAAACVISEGAYIAGINDSKKLLPKRRNALYEQLIAHHQVIYAIASVSSEEIDSINIFQATMVAMRRAVAQLKCMPELLLVDGSHAPHETIPCKCIVGGDAASYLIAAASILAKESRDRLMVEYHQKWPQYGFDQHKGYGTKEHLDALYKHGPCPIHRFSFEPVKNLKKLS